MYNAQEILNNLSKVEGILKALIVDQDGFIIASSESPNWDTEAVGVMVTTSLRSSQTMGNELNIGRATLTMIEFEQSTIVIAAVGPDASLAVITDASPNLGNIRYYVKRYSHELIKNTLDEALHIEMQ